MQRAAACLFIWQWRSMLHGNCPRKTIFSSGRWSRQSSSDAINSLTVRLMSISAVITAFNSIVEKVGEAVCSPTAAI